VCAFQKEKPSEPEPTSAALKGGHRERGRERLTREDVDIVADTGKERLLGGGGLVRERSGVDIVTDTEEERLLVQERERAQDSERERSRVHMALGILGPGFWDTGTGVGGDRKISVAELAHKPVREPVLLQTL
jgi:hypothetical protein